jgi:hypothetical protein
MEGSYWHQTERNVISCGAGEVKVSGVVTDALPPVGFSAPTFRRTGTSRLS